MLFAACGRIMVVRGNSERNCKATPKLKALWKLDRRSLAGLRFRLSLALDGPLEVICAELRRCGPSCSNSVPVRTRVQLCYIVCAISSHTQLVVPGSAVDALVDHVWLADREVHIFVSMIDFSTFVSGIASAPSAGTWLTASTNTQKVVEQS